MDIKTIRYHCQNCGKHFELREEESPRCPSCFWTSSIRSLDEPEALERKPTSAARPTRDFPFKIMPVKVPKAFFQFLWIAILILLIGSGFYYLVVKTKLVQKIGQSISKKSSTTQVSSTALKPKAASSNASAHAKASLPLLLSEEERTVLTNKESIAIPRKLSEDEMEIVNRRVDFPIDGQALPALKFWSEKEFKDFLTTEQKARGIQFSWGYEHSLNKLFTEHYLKAGGLFQKKEIDPAQQELFKALLFPVYSNDIRLHRAVALVMLQKYISDVLEKVKALNGYTLQQTVAQGLNDLKENYDGFFGVAKQSNWDEALQFIQRLEDKAKLLETEINQFEVKPSPVISQIDPDIQRGLSFHRETASTLTSNLNSILADLRIKKKTLEQNTSKSLETVKTKYEAALVAIQDQKWQEALTLLESVAYPPEAADDAKRKTAVLLRLVEKPKT
ncbi:MAG: zinc ribbon domain-containing protein [Candidatus Omnitrophica bacterium]|nr:zinc ribbon domain-containing protein [Candidatus Omnitrophota bacterium]